MTTVRNVNVATENLIKRKEGLVLHPYLCPAKVWTIGYGTIRYPSWYLGGKAVGPNDPPINEGQALMFMREDLDRFELFVASQLKKPANDNEFGAMVSLTYNIGVGGFASSSVLRLFNQGDKMGAMRAFALWNKADLNGDGRVDQAEVVPGLVVRRKEEQTLFLTPDLADAVPQPEPLPAIEMAPEFPMPQAVINPEVGPVKQAATSTTLQTAAVAGVATAAGAVTTTASIVDTMNTAAQVTQAANTMATATAGTAQIAATGLNSIGNLQIVALVMSGVALASIVFFGVRYFLKKRHNQVMG